MAYDSKKFDGIVAEVLGQVQAMLQQKNRKYGDSALAPIQIFSKANKIELINARIDDKLNRIKNGNLDEDEDLLMDLMGYLVLLRIATKEPSFTSTA